VLISELDAHLERCTHRLIEDPWIVKDLNVIGSSEKREFLRPTEEQISNVIELIRRIYPQIEHEFLELGTQRFYSGQMADVDISNQERRKHLIQAGAIIDHLQAHGLLHNSDDSCLIDLGSGKAQLIYWMTKQAPQCKYLLVERTGSRKKFDRKALQVNF
jgi:hypothetical protein